MGLRRQRQAAARGKARRGQAQQAQQPGTAGTCPLLTVQVAEGHLRLNHPELGQVARGVAVLRAERGAWAEGRRRQHARRGWFSTRVVSRCAWRTLRALTNQTASATPTNDETTRRPRRLTKGVDVGEAACVVLACGAGQGSRACSSCIPHSIKRADTLRCGMRPVLLLPLQNASRTCTSRKHVQPCNTA